MAGPVRTAVGRRPPRLGSRRWHKLPYVGAEHPGWRQLAVCVLLKACTDAAGKPDVPAPLDGEPVREAVARGERRNSAGEAARRRAAAEEGRL